MSEIDALEVRIAMLEKRIDALDGYVRHGVMVLLGAAGIVLWEPFQKILEIVK